MLFLNIHLVKLKLNKNLTVSNSWSIIYHKFLSKLCKTVFNFINLCLIHSHLIVTPFPNVKLRIRIENIYTSAKSVAKHKFKSSTWILVSGLPSSGSHSKFRVSPSESASEISTADAVVLGSICGLSRFPLQDTPAVVCRKIYQARHRRPVRSLTSLSSPTYIR